MQSTRKIFTDPKLADFSNYTSLFKLSRFTIENHLSISVGQYSFFMYVAEGTGQIKINGTSSTLSPGTLCLLHTYHFFEITADPNAPLSFCVLPYDYLLWSYLFVYDYAPIFGVEGNAYAPVIHPTNHQADVIYAIFEQLELEESLSDNQSTLTKSALIGQLIVLFRQYLMIEIKKGLATPLSFGGQILNYIYVYTTDINASSDCAVHFAISPNQLNRELVSVSGHTFSWHIKRSRVNKSLSYIFYPELSYQQIAMMSGFSSESEFYKAFNELIGITPSKYRDVLLYSENGYKHMVAIEPISAITYMIENFSSHINLTAITDAFHITPEKLNRLFKDSYGITYRDILSELQLIHAKNLLGMCDFPCIDVALQCGYNSASTLLRAFRKKYGMTPNEYRDSLRRQ